MNKQRIKRGLTVLLFLLFGCGSLQSQKKEIEEAIKRGPDPVLASYFASFSKHKDGIDALRLGKIEKILSNHSMMMIGWNISKTNSYYHEIVDKHVNEVIIKHIRFLEKEKVADKPDFGEIIYRPLGNLKFGYKNLSYDYVYTDNMHLMHLYHYSLDDKYIVFEGFLDFDEEVLFVIDKNMDGQMDLVFGLSNEGDPFIKIKDKDESSRFSCLSLNNDFYHVNGKVRMKIPIEVLQVDGKSGTIDLYLVIRLNDVFYANEGTSLLFDKRKHGSDRIVVFPDEVHSAASRPAGIGNLPEVRSISGSLNLSNLSSYKIKIPERDTLVQLEEGERRARMHHPGTKKTIEGGWDGDILGGWAHGLGAFRYENEYCNSFSFEGFVDKGKINGLGTIEGKIGTISGMFKDGVLNGEGVNTFVSPIPFGRKSIKTVVSKYEDGLPVGGAIAYDSRGRYIAKGKSDGRRINFELPGENDLDDLIAAGLNIVAGYRTYKELMTVKGFKDFVNRYSDAILECGGEYLDDENISVYEFITLLSSIIDKRDWGSKNELKSIGGRKLIDFLNENDFQRTANSVEINMFIECVIDERVKVKRE